MSFKQQNGNQQDNPDLTIQNGGTDSALEDDRSEQYSPVNFADVMQGHSFSKQNDAPRNDIGWLNDVTFTGTAGTEFAALRGADQGLQNPFDLRSLDFAHPDRDQLQNLANTFKTRPEDVARLLTEAVASSTSVPPEKQKVYLNEADAQIGSVLGEINVGTADAGDLGRLLSAYSNLNGFPDGAVKQGAVGAMMDKVRNALAAVAAGRAVGNFDYASIIHNRQTASMVRHRAEEQDRTV